MESNLHPCRHNGFTRQYVTLRSFYVVRHRTDLSTVMMEFARRSLFRRCIPCPDEPPKCNCGPDETCTEISRSCNQCPTTTCIKNSDIHGGTSTNTGGSGSNAGAIAGGVIGGLAFIGIVTFLIWWFVIRKKRSAILEQEKTAAAQASQRPRSMQSIASTVFTRASNVIQIAYIPGLTNRPGSSAPSQPDQHYFVPADLRNSQYSLDRHSIATSLARSSVATTIYRSDAIVSPVPAQQAMRGKAAVISVKSGTSTPTDAQSIRTMDAPAVPAITDAQLRKAGLVAEGGSTIVARSMIARPVNVTRPGQPKVSTVTEETGKKSDADRSTNSSSSSSSESAASHTRAQQLDEESSSSDSDSSSDESESDSESRSRHVNSHTRTASADAPEVVIQLTDDAGPFADQASSALASPTASTASTDLKDDNSAVSSGRSSGHHKSDSVHRQRLGAGLHRLAEENQARDRAQSPFSDEHEVK